MNPSIFGELTGELTVDDIGSEISLIPSILDPILQQAAGHESVSTDSEMGELLDFLLEKGIEEFEFDLAEPEGPVSPNHKWRYSSAFQKAVRRNDQSIFNAAISIQACDKDYIWRRGPTIAMEDVAQGDPWVVALVLNACRYVKHRKHYGPEKLAAFLGALMGAAVKDRLACDGFCLPIFHPDLKEMREQVEAMSLDDRANLYTSDATPFAWRVSAGISLCGSRYGSDVFMNDEGHPSFFFEALAPITPFPVWWISRQYARMARDAMFVSYPLVRRQLIAENDLKVVNAELPEQKLMEGVLDATFDIHTQEGKRALSYFCKSCPELVSYMEKRPHVKKKAVGIALFTADSSLLDRYIISPWALSLYQANLDGEAKGVGVSTEELAELAGIIERNRDKLNHARWKVTQ